MGTDESLFQQVEQDLWAWINEFVTVSNEFYHFKFPPCPYARGALLAKAVDVRVFRSGNVRKFIKEGAVDMRDNPKLTTRVMAFPPRTQWEWGINDYVEGINAELICDNVFLNTGVAKTTRSRYPGSPPNDPYFIVIANSLEAVMDGAKSLEKTEYYKDWPDVHFASVVERRARLAKRYGAKK